MNIVTHNVRDPFKFDYELHSGMILAAGAEKV